MISDEQRLFHSFLEQHDDLSWNELLDKLVPSIHSVDQNATRVWFGFFPLALERALESTPNVKEAMHRLKLEGRPLIKDQVDSSHHFLYGHRYWPEAKETLIEISRSKTPPQSLSLEDNIRTLAGRVAGSAGCKPNLTLGIASVALMTFQQVGPEAFQATRPETSRLPIHQKSPDQVLKLRIRQPIHALWSLIASGRRKHPVIFDENRAESRFEAIVGQDIAMAAAGDTRDYRSKDPRCTEGPIPVECRSGSCGSCWIGLLSGSEHLPAISEFEANRLKYFGYLRSCSEKHPLIRLACQNSISGPITIVIPPWNGVTGKLYLARCEDSTSTNP